MVRVYEPAALLLSEKVRMESPERQQRVIGSIIRVFDWGISASRYSRKIETWLGCMLFCIADFGVHATMVFWRKLKLSVSSGAVKEEQKFDLSIAVCFFSWDDLERQIYGIHGEGVHVRSMHGRFLFRTSGIREKSHHSHSVRRGVFLFSALHFYGRTISTLAWSQGG